MSPRDIEAPLDDEGEAVDRIDGTGSTNAATPAGNIFQDDIYAGNPFSFRSPTLSTHPNEHYDTFTGGLSLLFKDVDLPGIGGLGITINRTYSLNQVYQSIPPNRDPTSFEYQSGQFLGLGWQMHAGAVCGDLNLVSPPEVVQVVDSDQSVHQAFNVHDSNFILYALDDGSVLTITTTTAQAAPIWVLMRSDGRVLYFGQRPRQNSFQRCYLLTEADLYASLTLRVSYSIYDRVVVPQLMTLRSPSGLQAAPDVAFVVDSTDPSYPRLDYITVGGQKVMSYSHDNFVIAGQRYYLLRSVQAWTGTSSTGRPITFDYQAATDSMPRMLRRMNYPEAGVVQYDTAAVILNVLGVQTFHPVLTTKQVWPSPGAIPEIWQYTMTKADPFSLGEDVTTVVETPCNRVHKYVHAGYGFDQGPRGCSPAWPCPSGQTCGADLSCSDPARRPCMADAICAPGYCSGGYCYSQQYALWRMGSVIRSETRDGSDPMSATLVETRSYDFAASQLPLTPALIRTPFFGGFERHYIAELHGATVTRGSLSWHSTYSDFDLRSRPLTRTETGDGRTRRVRVQYQDIGTATSSVIQPRFLNRISREETDGPGDAVQASRVVQRSYRTQYYVAGQGPAGTLISETRDGVQHNYTFQPDGEPHSDELAGVGTSQLVTGLAGGAGNVTRVITTAANTRRYITTDSLGRLGESFIYLSQDLGWSTQYQHDGLNRLTQVTPPFASEVAPTVITYSYGTNGLPQRQATRGRLKVIERYDGLGRLTATETGTGTLARATLRQYDACGEVSAESHPFVGDAAWAVQNPGAIRWETYTRDKLGRVTRLDHPDGTFVTFEQDPSNRHGERRHDEVGHDVDTFYQSYGDPAGGQVVEVRSPPGTGVAVQYSRDVLGHLRTLTRPDGAVDSFHYDPTTNFLDQETHPESGTTLYAPRPNTAWVQTRTDGAGRVATYNYDLDGRVRTIALDQTATAAESLSFAYWTPDGTSTFTWDLLSSAAREGGTSVTGRTFRSQIDRSYDADLTLMEEQSTTYCGPAGAWQTDVFWFRTPEGFPRESVLPGGFTVDMTTNAVGDTVGVRTQRVGVAGSQTAISQAVWHPNGELRQMVFGDGTAVQQTLHGTRDHVQTLTATASMGGPLINVTYGRRGDLRLTAVTDNLTPIIGPNSRTKQFSYDSLNRLQDSNGPWGSYTYAYQSGSGDRATITKNGSVETYQYNGHRLATVVPTSTTSSTRSFSSYDGAGRVLQEDRSLGGTTSSVIYRYSGDGYLASVSSAGTTENYQLDPFGRPACVRDPGPAQKKRYWTFGPQGDLLYSEEQSPTGQGQGTMYARIRGKVYSTRAWAQVGGTRSDLGHTNLINDSMGTALAALQQQTGAITQQETTPFGELVWNPEFPAVYQSHSRVRGALQTGEPFDMFDTPARMYSASLGRYLTPDPQLGAVGQVLGHDRYSHALNDPNMYIDPSGRVPLLGPGLAYLAATTSSGLTVGGGLATVAAAGVVIPAALGGAVGYLIGDTEVVATAAQFWLEKALGAPYEGAPPFGTDGGGAKRGIYEFPDQASGGTPYVGQSGNIPERLADHQRAGRLAPGTETIRPVEGGKTAREVAEYKRIQEITGGVPARQSPNVSNKVDPIGPRRQQLLEDK